MNHKTPLIFIFNLLFITYNFSQDIIFDWKHVIGNGQQNEAKTIVTDSAGYVYVGGSVNGTITFLDTTITATSPYYEGYVSKLSPEGNMVWFKWFRGDGEITSLCIDKENNLYVSGNYLKTVQFDTILHSNNTDSATVPNMLIAKFDTSGTLLWAKSTTGLQYLAGDGSGPLKKITVDNDNNLIITGRCIDKLQYFDTTATITTHDSVWTTNPYPHWEYYQPQTGFLAKYTSSGQKLWVKAIGGTNCYPYAVKTDNINNVLVTGMFKDSSIFDTISISSNWSNADNIFIAKYNTNGYINWAERAGGVGGSYGYDITVDNINNIYLTGVMDGNYPEFDSIIYYPYAGGAKAFIAKYNYLGNIIWLLPISVPHYVFQPTANYGASIKLIKDTIYLLGAFYRDTLNYNGTILMSNDRSNTFLLKIDLSGNVLKAGQYIGTAWARPQELAIDSDANIYLTEILGSDICIAKINSAFTVNSIFSDYFDTNNVSIFPNPCKDKLYVKFENSNNFEKKNIEIFDFTGKLSLVTTLEYNNYIDVSVLSGGIYVIRINEFKSKLIIQ